MSLLESSTDLGVSYCRNCSRSALVTPNFVVKTEFHYTDTLISLHHDDTLSLAICLHRILLTSDNAPLQTESFFRRRLSLPLCDHHLSPTLQISLLCSLWLTGGHLGPEELNQRNQVETQFTLMLRCCNTSSLKNLQTLK